MAKGSQTTLGRAFAPARGVGVDFIEDRAQRDVLASLFGGDVRSRAYDRFELLHRVGSGAMGTVYAAYDPKLDRRVALKILRTSDAEARRRHLVEARSLARLSHPAVVAVHDAGECDGHLYVAMEFVEGESLREWLDEHQPTVDEVLEVFSQAGAGLVAAHRAGIVHRDFKPANVLVNHETAGELRVRVADFGLATDAAAAAESSRDLEHLTIEDAARTSGGIVGTPLYMAPEQMEGRQADAVADQFAFCVSLYEALAGQPPFPGPGRADRLGQIREGAPALGRPTPPWVAKVVMRGLSWSPEHRFENMAALLDALSGRRRRRHRRWVLGGAVALAGLGAYELGRRSIPQPCDDVDESVWQLWDDARRESLHAKLSAVTVPYAEATASSVIDSLDRYTTQLALSQRQSCREAWSEEGDEARGRERCFIGVRLKLAAAIDVLGRGYPETTANAHRIVELLPRIDDCERARVVPPLPRDGGRRDGVRRGQRALAELTARVRARQPNLVTEARQLEAMVGELGYAPLHAEAAALTAELERRQGDIESASAGLRRSLWLGVSSGDPRVAAKAALQIGHLEVYDNLRTEPARDWIDLARALSRQAGDPDGLNAKTMLAEAELANGSRDAEATVEWARRALEHGPEGPRGRLRALLLLALGQKALGDVDGASRTYDTALQHVEDEYGHAHPHEATVLSNYGTMLETSGQPERARSMLRRAAESTEALHGPLHPRTAEVWANFAVSLGETDEAVQIQRRTVKVLSAHYGERHVKVAMGHANIGRALVTLERPFEALDACRAATRSLPPDVHGRPVAHVATCEADALMALDRAAEAVTILAPLVAAGALDDPAALAGAQFEYGRALYASGERASGRDWVRRAVPAYRTMIGSGSPSISAPEVWLAAHDESSDATDPNADGARG